MILRLYRQLSLLYTMKGKCPALYSITLRLNRRHYSKRWQVRPSPLNYNIETPQTTSQQYKMTDEAQPVGLWHWDSSIYSLILTKTGKNPTRLTMNLSLHRLFSNLHDKRKTQPIGLWQWDSTDYRLLYTIKVRLSPLDYDIETLKTTLNSKR